MSRIISLLVMLPALLLMHCVSPGVDNRLNKLEAKQDSILKLLSTMREQGEFVAMKVGWRPPRDTTPKVIPVGTSYSQGPENAALTIVEFSDMQCPYCAQSAPILDSLARAYPNDVRVIFKHFPLSFHPQARSAAAASIAAGRQGKFFAFRYKVAPLFRTLNDSTYLAVAKEIGLNMEQFKQEMALTSDVNKILDEDMNLGREIGVEGTPTIFVNGKLAQDRSFEYFVTLLKRTKS